MTLPTEPDFSDPRLTAYLLDELEAEERAAFEAEMARDPALRDALADLRRVSGVLGRVYREEALPPDRSAAPGLTSPPPRELSPQARAARIARLKHDAPKLEKSTRSRMTSMAAAMVASVALAGIILLQRASEDIGTGDDRELAEVSSGETWKPAETLEQRIESHLEAERAEAEQAYASVADEVASGLGAIELAAVPEPSAAPEPSVEALLNPEAPNWVAVERLAEATAPATVSPEELEKERARERALAAVGTPRPALGSLADAGWSTDLPTGPTAAPVIVAGGFRTPSGMPKSAFVLNIGNASYGAVRTALREARWPALEDVRVEELINQFAYAEQSPRRMDPPFAVELEIGQAPWEPVHYLVRVTLKAAEIDEASGKPVPLAMVAHDVRAEVRFNPTQVAAYRLLGFENGAEKGASTDASMDTPGQALLAGDETTALYEVVPVGAPSTVGGVGDADFEAAPEAAVAYLERTSELLWMEMRYERPESERMRRIDFILHVPTEIPSWRETSRSFRWAAAVASFGMELKDDPWRGRIDWDLIQALAHSTMDSDEVSADRREFLELIDEASALARARGAS